MPDVAINAQAVINAGQGYVVPESQEIVVRAVRASYNGSGAAGSYVPTLQLVSDAGIVVAECPIAETLVAGASADVSWFRGVKPAAPVAGGGIQFDTDNQGGYLSVTTNDPVPGFTSGMELRDAQDGGGIGIASIGDNGLVLIEAGDGTTTGGRIDLNAYDDGAGDGYINVASDGQTVIEATTGAQIHSSDGDVRLRLGNTWSLTIEDHSNVILLEVREDGGAFVVLVKNKTGAGVFRIDNDGALHGLTGQALTFDL